MSLRTTVIDHQTLPVQTFHPISYEMWTKITSNVSVLAISILVQILCAY